MGRSFWEENQDFKRIGGGEEYQGKKVRGNIKWERGEVGGGFREENNQDFKRFGVGEENQGKKT